MAGESNLDREEARARARLIHDLRYEVTLDLTGETNFGSESRIQFRCREPGARTFLDMTAPEVDRRRDQLGPKTADERRVAEHGVPRDLDEAALLRILEHLLGRAEELRELPGLLLRL